MKVFSYYCLLPLRKSATLSHKPGTEQPDIYRILWNVILWVELSV